MLHYLDDVRLETTILGLSRSSA